MKKFTRISTLALVLVLVCLCTASAFAVSVSGTPVPVGNSQIETTLVLEANRAASSVVLEPGSDYCEGTITITYTTCPEDMLRPSAYETRSGSDSYNKTTGGSYSMTASSGMISIEATADYYVYVIVNGTAYTRYPADLYLEY